MSKSVEPDRAYYKYWKRLRDAPYNPKLVAKVIYIRAPEAMVARVVKAVRKEKDLDWQFKNDNRLDPYRLHWSFELTKVGLIPGDGSGVITLKLDRRSDI